MITVQKLSSLAFFYHDGIEKSENLTEEQKKTCIRFKINFLFDKFLRFDS